MTDRIGDRDNPDEPGGFGSGGGQSVHGEAYVNIYDAKTQLSQLIARVEAGEEIVIARGGRPVARLVPLTKRVPDRTLGLMKGRIKIHDGFDDPLPEFDDEGSDPLV